MTQFQPVHTQQTGDDEARLDASHDPVESGSDAHVISHRAEKALQLAHQRTQGQKLVAASRYNLHRRDIRFEPGDRMWVWAAIQRRDLKEKLLRPCFGDLYYELLPEGTRT